MNQRKSGIDLIRCLGLLFVVGVHSFLKNGFYYEPQTTAAMLLPNTFRWLFYGCNGIFMILTGYLKSSKKLDKGYYRSLLPILMGYFLTCVFSFPIRHFLLDEKLTVFEWTEKMFTFANYGWYVEMYIGLFLLAPFINMVLDAAQTPKQQYAFAGTMVILTALPSITAANWIPDYWTALYPITYYVLGAVIRRQNLRLKPWIGACGAFAVAAALGLVSLLTTDSGFSNGFTQGYGGFWITLMVTLLFLGLYHVKLPDFPAWVLAWCAGGVFEGYILSRLFDVWVYAQFSQWHEPGKYWIGYLCITLPIFIISLMLGKAVHTLAEKLTAPRKKKVSA